MAPVRVHQEDLRATVPIAGEGDCASIGRPRRVRIVALVGHAPRSRAIGVDHVNLKGSALSTSKGDQPPIRRPGCFIIIGAAVRELSEATAVLPDHVDRLVSALEEKRRQLSRDLARHQHAEGAYMELGSKLIELIAQAPQIFERADAEQRRELVGLLTSNRVMNGKTLEFELRKPFDVLVSAANRENGWGARIRT